MKKFTYAVLLALFLCAPTQTYTIPPDSGPSANGSLQFTLEDGFDRSFQFNARTHKDGSTTGEMTFSDPIGIPNPESEAGPSGFYAKASFDCLVIRGNKAVMSGIITESTIGELIAHRVLLVVEDGGGGNNETKSDKLTWGVYRNPNRTWIPQDAEVPGDQGALLDWLATDSERTDDVGIQARRSETIGCQTFSVSSYSLVDVKHGQGNIQVKP